MTAIPLTSEGGLARFREDLLERLLFSHPTLLPIADIDSSYIDPIPVCTQLSTRVGPLDVLYVTQNGRLVIAEAKLWRNPEARRKVIGQILDYAAELSRWQYEDLDREVRRRTGGIPLATFASRNEAGFDEASFVDEVWRTLREGRFLLLVCGDGIREELASIAEFLDRSTTLDLTFGLVELAFFNMPGGDTLVQPRVLAKTVVLSRKVFRFETPSQSALAIAASPAEEIDGQAELVPVGQQESIAFWTEVRDALKLDDALQPLPTATRTWNTSLRMPSPRAWITLYLERGKSEEGLFLTFNRGQPGDLFYSRLVEERELIEGELPPGATWVSDGSRHQIMLTRREVDISNPPGRASAIEWLAVNANIFVNVFRPRIARYLEEMK